MRYPRSAIGRISFLPTKLLGCYEPDLAPVFADAAGFDVFVDVGSADGYYCVGFKRRFPHTHVIGFETDRFQRRLSHKLARLNGVTVDARGTADQRALDALPPGRLLLMTDIEGYEYELLNPATLPMLHAATMIIEAHRKVHPDVVEVLSSRFEHSHTIQLVHARPRKTSDYQELAGWKDDMARLALFDAQSLWLVLRPVDD